MKIEYLEGIASQAQLKETSLIFKKTWQKAYQNVLPKNELKNLDEKIWQKSLLQAGRHNLLALKQEKIVGVVSYGPRRDHSELKENVGEVYSLYVLPAFQHQGIGHELLTRVETDLSKLGYQKVILWVLANNVSAQNFYLKHGWRESKIGRQETILGKPMQLLQFEKSL